MIVVLYYGNRDAAAKMLSDKSPLSEANCFMLWLNVRQIKYLWET